MPATHATSKRETLINRLLAGTAIGMALSMIGGAARAQSADQPIQLPPISVQTNRPNEGGYRMNDPTLPKLTEPLRDTPQSITVVPKQYMQDRGVTNFSDALRGVPGISLAAGEAGAQGNNLNL